MKPLLLLLVLFLFESLSFAALPKRHVATVIEKIDAAGYTYMQVKEGENSYWVAVTATPVVGGQNVTFDEQMWMQNFPSKALNRTFDKILFASVTQAQNAHAMPVKPRTAPQEIIAKIDGGYSVYDVFANRTTLKGKEITVRAKVTKTSSQILKRNWVHLEDGTGDAGSDDLVFTCSEPLDIKAGDIVVATGRVVVDKDFGFGYFYPVIIEESRFRIEK